MQLRFEQVTQVYASPSADPRTILNIPQLTIESGSQVLLRGVSGSGKTTFFNIAAGLLKPTTGAVYYDDVALYGMSEAARDRYRAQRVGYIFQTHYLLNALTALENVVMPMAFANAMSKSEWRQRALTLLAAVDLADHAHYRPSQLSTGQRMRVAVARAMANHPQVLFADEPTASLDSGTGERVMDILQETCQKLGATLLVASHDPALTGRFSIFASLEKGIMTMQEAQNA